MLVPQQWLAHFGKCECLWSKFPGKLELVWLEWQGLMKGSQETKQTTKCPVHDHLGYIFLVVCLFPVLSVWGFVFLRRRGGGGRGLNAT